ncbi:TetR/AcrR family transcriptional regulator [Aquicoccus porphyridii]|uniref:TetR/AcrR family transcriptional regulator n=1 Tax=Aquicoccus porphyridii TaxID=1852029 RepID=UPI00165DEC05|nr:TetR/AcrR family transcriptional regulator [Aquicoccus porphyridii]
MGDIAQDEGAKATPPGLRGRKKAQRRETILARSSELFAQKGIDATTMAEIADAVGVSTPTIFNYFGNKDGILIALITEGAQKARAEGLAPVMQKDSDFGTMLADLFTLFATRTLAIANKRIWRYAEAATIRHPGTELARNYVTVDEELVRVIVRFLDGYDIRLRSGASPDPQFLGQLFYDVWNPSFFNLIKSDEITLDQHRDDLLQRFVPLAGMLFDDAFLTNPTLKPGKP